MGLGLQNVHTCYFEKVAAHLPQNRKSSPKTLLRRRWPPPPVAASSPGRRSPPSSPPPDLRRRPLPGNSAPPQPHPGASRTCPGCRRSWGARSRCCRCTARWRRRD